jgi:acetylornithine deacetylase/succinyl-diaminopimelate desuccinylase-like protein
MLPSKVADYLQAHQDQHIEQLKQLLRFPSIANVPADAAGRDACEDCARWLADHARALGLDTHILPTGGKSVVFAQAPAPAGAPTVLIYGHYDVQPPDPLDDWVTPPFEPDIRDGKVFARGANDDKGQLFTHLMAIEAWQACGGLPVGIKLFLEGEEEIGSPTIEPFIAEHADLLGADACLVSDSEFFAPGLPSITYCLRGLACGELTVTGPGADIHSGVHGGAVANPVHGLAKLIAGMTDATGRVTLPGFYDNVLELTDEERQMWASLPFTEADYAARAGVDDLAGGEQGFSVLERRWARPTLDCNGIFGGYMQAGSKTIIPASAGTKISMRLVPDQDPQRILDAMARYLEANTPPGLSAHFRPYASARPVMIPRDSTPMRIASAALAESFGQEPVFTRCGASVPITEIIQRLLKIDPIMMGFGLPDDSIHSPNEKFNLDQLHGGARASAAFLAGLASR